MILSKNFIVFLAGLVALGSLFACNEAKKESPKTPEQILFEGIDAIYCTPVLTDCSPCDITMLDDTLFVNYQGVQSSKNSIKLQFIQYSDTDRMCEFNEITNGKPSGKYMFYLTPDTLSRELLRLRYEKPNGKVCDFYSHAVYGCENVNTKDIRAVEDSVIKLSDRYSSTQDPTQFEMLSYLLHSNKNAKKYDFETLGELTSWKSVNSYNENLRFLWNAQSSQLAGDPKMQMLLQYENNGNVYTIDHFAEQVMELAQKENKLEMTDILDITAQNIDLDWNNTAYYFVDMCCLANGKSKYNRVYMLLFVDDGKIEFKNITKGKKLMVMPYYDSYDLMKTVTYYIHPYAGSTELYVPMLKFGSRGLFQDGWMTYVWKDSVFKYLGY